MPSAVLFAGPQKHTAIVSSGDMRLKMGFDQRRELKIRGGLEQKKHTAVKVM